MDAQRTRRTVVVGVDGSAYALRAVRWGAAEARRRWTPLRLVTAFGWGPGRDTSRPGREKHYRDALLDRSRHHLLAAAAAAEGEFQDVELEQELVVGHPISVLGAEARRAQVVVLGDRGMSRVGGVLVGSVAVGLAVHASCPVIVVRGSDREPLEAASAPVVVGMDGSGGADAAIAFAFEAAAARRVSFVAVHAWSDLVLDPSMSAVVVDYEAIESGERNVLDERLACWTAKYPDVAVERVLTRDGPARGLLEQANRAQLVVVGSRGRGEFAGLVLGSVSHALLHRASCPVAVIGPDTR